MCKKLIYLIFVMSLLGLPEVQAQLEWDRTVYWDGRYPVNWGGDGVAMRDALEAAGYTILDADELKTWMDARIADEKLSVVVFCRDSMPDTVAESMDANCTLRRYLDAGGKCVWYADIPFYYQAHSDGTQTTWDTAGSTAVLGFNAATVWDTANPAIITATGLAWGLTQTWNSARATSPSGLTVLATDSAGNALAWVKHYAAGDKFRGFVRLWDASGTPPVEDVIRVAEYLALKATAPDPPDGGECDQTYATLGWSAGSTAVQHDVYFGTDAAEVAAGTGDTAKGQQTDVFYFIGDLVPGATYYWRIDEVEADGTTVHTGEVWSFTVKRPIAVDPSPADGARYVNPDVVLSWDPGLGAIIHHVYFGTDEIEVTDGTGDTYKAPTADATYTPGTLEEGTTYYWRIDEFDGPATHTGDIWSFTTIPHIPIRDPNLVGWWKLDDMGSGTVIDFSGYGHHGTIHGDAHFVLGYAGEAVEFDGSGDYVNIDGYKGITVVGGVQPEFTLMAWINTTSNAEIITWGNNSGRQRMTFRVDTVLRVEHGGGNIRGTLGADLRDGEWHHVAATMRQDANQNIWIDDRSVTLYVDGVNVTPDVADDPDTFNLQPNTDVSIGRNAPRNDRYFTGLIDDARIYDRTLTQEEIQQIMLRPNPYTAWGPWPVDGGTEDVERALPLSWSPGDLVAQHDVYLGTDQSAVAAAETSDTSGIYRGRQDANTYTPTLDYDQTYYWRIDEYNTDDTLTPGNLWSFTVGNFLIVDDMEAYDDYCNRIFYSWTDGYGHSADPDCGIEASAGNGSGSTVGGTEPPYAEQTIVHGGTQSMPFAYDNSALPYYSEAEYAFGSPQDWTRHGVKALTLWFRGEPASVGSFSYDPASGIYTLTGDGADIWGTADAFHYVFKRLSGDGEIVARVVSIGGPSTNEWRKAGAMIRESLDAGAKHAFMAITPGIAHGVAFQSRPTTNASSVSAHYDVSATLPAWDDTALIAAVWVRLVRQANQFTAYYSQNGAGWMIVQGDADLPNPQILDVGENVYIGLAVTSHAAGVLSTCEFDNVSTSGGVSGQWTSRDVPSNDPDPLYVAVEDSLGNIKVATNPDAAAVQQSTWQEWNIDMREFSNAGVNLTSIAKMLIGVGNPDNPQMGGTGQLYFDDIWLYRPRCVASVLKPEADFTNDCVVDHSDVETLADNWLRIIWDTTGGPDGSGSLVFGPTGDYVAIEDLHYAGTGFTQVSVSAWIRTASEADQYIISFDRNEYYRLEINGSGAGPGQVGWDVMTVTDGTEQQLDYGSVTRVDDDQWHHVVGVFDNGTATIYIDGTAEPSATGGPIFGTGETRFGFLGANSEATEFDGARGGGNPIQHLDDLRVYDYALSAADVTGLAQGTAEPATGPILWYKLDETSGDIAADASGNGYDGHLVFSWFDMNLHDDDVLNFKDFALVADQWLDEMLWPQP